MTLVALVETSFGTLVVTYRLTTCGGPLVVVVALWEGVVDDHILLGTPHVLNKLFVGGGEVPCIDLVLLEEVHDFPGAVEKEPLVFRGAVVESVFERDQLQYLAIGQFTLVETDHSFDDCLQVDLVVLGRLLLVVRDCGPEHLLDGLMQVGFVLL